MNEQVTWRRTIDGTVATITFADGRVERWRWSWLVDVATASLWVAVHLSTASPQVVHTCGLRVPQPERL